MCKDDLFVLCSLWEVRAPLRSFFSPDPGLGFNLPYKPLDCRRSIIKLLNHGFINVNSSLNDYFFKDGESLMISHDNRDQDEYILGLTKFGGGLWEYYLKPDWSKYVSGLDFWEGDGEAYYYFIVSDKNNADLIIDKIQKSDSHDGFYIQAKDFSHLTYWKKMSCYRIKCFGRGNGIKGALGFKNLFLYDILDESCRKFNDEILVKLFALFK